MTLINSKTKLYALIGDPIDHSLSPLMQNTAFRSLGLNCIYLCFRIKAKMLENVVNGIKNFNILGFNVTIPHKVSIIKYLDEVDPLAKNIGAVNTVVNRNGKLIGYNTDGLGALKALEVESVRLKDKKVVILGAGGASKALSFSIAPLAKSIVILNRTESKATELASNLRTKFSKNIWGRKLTQINMSKELIDSNILINATSVGMYPQIKECLVNKRLLHSDLVVFDIVYNPLRTRLLREAKKVGAKDVNGLSMLVYQGTLSFEIWTGIKPPVDIMFKVVKKALRR